MSTDANLGNKIHNHLVTLGIETPATFGTVPDKHRIETLFRQFMCELGLDLTDDSLADTPKRIARMYVNEIFFGLDYANFPKCTAIENKFKHDEMIIVKDINLQSVCEHHFVVIDGFCNIAYIPQNTVLGLSKMNRLVKFFSRRPQVQERLTEQIHAAISYICETSHVAVNIKATHFCVKQRGVEDTHSVTITSKLSGAFRDYPEARAEFLSLCK